MGNSLERGHVFAGYKIEYLLGAGGMGEVYLAQDRDLPRMIALKVLPPLASIDPDLRKRFERETHAVAALVHPNIVAIHAGGEERGRPWISMAYIDGSDADIELRSGPLALDRSVSIITDVAEALDYAHDHGILHRDVKPANILLTKGRREHAILTDFGIAKSTNETSQLTSTSNMIASFRYAAPERFSDKMTVDRRADGYSLGCTLYQLLTGVLPYTGDMMQLVAAHTGSPIPRPSSQNPSVPTAFDGVIDRALAKDPRNRFNSCSQLAAAALRALESVPRTPYPAHEIEMAWSDIRAKVREYGASVHAMMSGARLIRIDGETIVLGHQHAMLAERLIQPHNRDALLAAFRSVLGSDVYDIEWEVGAAKPLSSTAHSPAAAATSPHRARKANS
ncbi:protein kinase [Nocardia sp. NPDC057668]|uniref:serine/threonine-protein kinase n=1 Tax=Nocardia sp. NPDC057668 TaxID=3346202 RepID=UPI00366C327B